MSKLAEQKVYQDDFIRRVRLMFADTLFGQLRQTVFGENAVDVLAAHLNVETEDVNKWLRAEALPSQELMRRMMVIFKGSNRLNDHSDCMTSIVELAEEAERAKILRNIEITQSKSG